MADGDPWSLDRIAAKYVADSSVTYRFRVLERYQLQAALGWDSNVLTLTSPPPKGLKPRVWLTFDAGAHANRRRVAIGTNTAYIAGVIGTTTCAVQNPSTDVEDTFTLYGMEGERTRGWELD